MRCLGVQPSIISRHWARIHSFLAGMTVDLSSLDAHEQPSEALKGTWKSYSKTDSSDFLSHPDIDDLSVPEKAKEFCTAGHIPSERLISAFQRIEGQNWEAGRVVKDAPIYFHPLLPGRSSRKCLTGREY